MMTDIAKQRRAFARRVERACKAAGYHVTLHNTKQWVRFITNAQLIRNKCACWVARDLFPVRRLPGRRLHLRGRGHALYVSKTATVGAA